MLSKKPARWTRWDWGAGLWVLLGAAGLTAAAARGIEAYATFPASFDEAAHLLPILQLAGDLRRLDGWAFWGHSYAQDQIALYPFLHSWLSVPAFLLFPPSTLLGRLTSLAFLSLAILLSYALGRELAPAAPGRWLSGVLGATLTAAALPLWVYSSVVYLEPAGLLVTLAALYCYVQAAPDEPARPFWALAYSGLTLGALLTKYSFGVFLIGGGLLTEAARVVWTRRVEAGRWGRLFGPLALGALAWFASPGKFERLILYSQSQQTHDSVGSLANLLYYPRSLAWHYTSGPLSWVLLLAGLGFGIWRFRQHSYRAMLCYLSLSLIAVTLVPQKEPRFLFTIAPAALLLGGAAGAWIAAEVLARCRTAWARRGALGIGVLLAGFELLAMGRRLTALPAAQEVGYTSPPAVSQAYDFIARYTLAQGLRPLILDYWHAFNHFGLTWHYSAAQPSASVDPLLSLGDLAPNPAALGPFLHDLQTQHVGALVSIDGSPAGQYTGWQVIQPLWAQGTIDLIASSEPYTMTVLSTEYRDALFSGAYLDPASLTQARQAALSQWPIQIHLYRLTAP